MRRQPEQDRRREAVALALGARRLRYVGVLEVRSLSRRGHWEEKDRSMASRRAAVFFMRAQSMPDWHGEIIWIELTVTDANGQSGYASVMPITSSPSTPC